MNELENRAHQPENINDAVQIENIYRQVRGYVVDAQRQVYKAVNAAMVEAYWQIGKVVYEVCGENDRAAYGKQVIQYLSEQLTAESGRGFSVQGLRNMRQFYRTFPIRSTVWSELSWSHYRLLMRVQDEKARTFYTEEAAKSGWSVLQLQRQINTMYYQRMLASQDKQSVTQRLKQLCRSLNMKKSSKTSMCWNSLICQRMNISMNQISNRRSSITCRNSCLSWAKASPLSRARSISISKAGTFTLIWCSTTTF